MYAHREKCNRRFRFLNFRLDCADWARKMILQCSDDLRPGRVAIVNGTGLPALDLAVPPDTVVQLKRDLKVHLLNANLNDEFECRHISKRIGVILNAVLGMQTGVPYLII